MVSERAPGGASANRLMPSSRALATLSCSFVAAATVLSGSSSKTGFLCVQIELLSSSKFLGFLEQDSKYHFGRSKAYCFL